MGTIGKKAAGFVRNGLAAVGLYTVADKVDALDDTGQNLLGIGLIGLVLILLLRR